MRRLILGMALVAGSMGVDSTGNVSFSRAARADEGPAAATPRSACTRQAGVDLRPEIATGLRQHDAGQYQEAVATFLRVAQQIPAVRSLAARSLLEEGDVSAAYQQAGIAVREANGMPVTHFMLALVAQRAGHLDESLAEYQRTLQLDPSNSATHNNLGGLYYEREDFVNARAETEIALRLAGDPRGTAIAMANLAELDALAGHFDTAEEKLNQTLEATPEDSIPYFGLAALYDVMGRDDAAASMEKNALALDPLGVTRRSTSWVWPELQLHSEGLEAEAQGNQAVALEKWTALKQIEDGAGLRWTPLKGRAAAHLAKLGAVAAAAPTADLVKAETVVVR